jgi:luciferase family oxidoreductase group 1
MPLTLSVLDLVPVFYGSTSVDALRGAAEFARAIDRLGYARLWYGEHHNLPGLATTSPEIMIAHVGSMTKHIRLGAGGVMLPNHSPLKVAESYKLLEALHPGRIDLGIGRAPGTDRMTTLALRVRKDDTLDDFPEQLSNLIAWGKGAFPSDHPLREIHAMPDDRSLPPIYLLGSSEHSAKLAAKMGTAFAFAGHLSPSPPDSSLLAYRSEFSSNHSGQRPHAILALEVYCAETEQEARRMTLTRLAPFASLQAKSSAPVRNSQEPEPRAVAEEQQKTIARFRNLRVVGTRAQVHACLQEIAIRTRADEVMIATHTPETEARIHSYELLADAFGLARCQKISGN